MRWLFLATILTAGCLSQLVPEHKEATLAKPDLAAEEPMPEEDLAPATGDMGLPCTMLGQADPACPNDGQCNQKGFCKP